MTFEFDNLTWRCDICGLTRPDEVIGVRKVDIGPKSSPGMCIRNVKYCLDSPACADGALNWQEPVRPVIAGMIRTAKPPRSIAALLPYVLMVVAVVIAGVAFLVLATR
jgi:hypothetical protein